MMMGPLNFYCSIFWALLATTIAIPMKLATRDPTDVGLTTAEMVAKHGYPSETHYLTTSDGFILEIHRIPYGIGGSPGGVPVILMHGMDASSADYVCLGPGISLGYLLADLGYDVWMPNARGNLYSRNHTTLNPDVDAAFWNFSFHEIALVDLAESVDFILETSGFTDLYYIGHSQGGTTFLVLNSIKPEYNSKFRLASLMAPAAFLNHTTDAFILALAPYVFLFEDLLNSLGVYEVPFKAAQREWGQQNCDKPENLAQCLDLMDGTGDPDQVDTTMLAVITTNNPGGKGMKQDYHFGQIVLTGNFSMYDYGAEANLNLYGSEIPPNYDLSQVTAPVAVYYGNNDVTVNFTDVGILMEQLPNVVRSYLVPYDMFSHVDFTFAKDLPTLVYNELMAFMQQN